MSAGTGSMAAAAGPMSVAAPDAPVVRLEAVVKSYTLGDTRVPALRGITLDIRQGEFVALTGPSGSGKSTLLHVCGLLDFPDEGRYQLDGRETSGLGPRELALLRRALLGFVFQGFNLVPVLTVLENVEYPLLLDGAPPAERKERVRRMLDRVGLGDLERRRPDELSGGQRQRVAIARALVKEPRLVLADEPTANLDSATATQVIDLMHELGRNQGATFIIASHDARVTARCDRAVALTDGALS